MSLLWNWKWWKEWVYSCGIVQSCFMPLRLVQIEHIVMVKDEDMYTPQALSGLGQKLAVLLGSCLSGSGMSYHFYNAQHV